jgi:hypothetical protein
MALHASQKLTGCAADIQKATLTFHSRNKSAALADAVSKNSILQKGSRINANVIGIISRWIMFSDFILVRPGILVD